ncbi:glucan biosynthesis protein [Luteolibacter sp. LG18]|uniref:glucan biosynthesis protein n=1 Tax=Luteolibacter sp. LG18 TaxID=2819286 RepID=UPI002B2F0F44|nr:glucans biosynthesis protein G [Luteolibacter sp. LG18]
MPLHPYRPIALALGVVAASGFARAQTWLREDVDFQKIEARAKELASQPYQAPDREALPGWMKALSYDQYRDIRFREDQALWLQGNLPFRAMFFHPGYLFRESVQVREFTSTHSQEVRFTPGFYDYGSLVGEKGEFPPNAGFAGVRLLSQLNQQGKFDELAVFQGASYWRALGKGQRYGISARGVAIDTGAEGSAEEFPSFREFWLRKPDQGDQAAQVLALLDGPSVAGAYAFVVQPGDDTVMTVKAVLFPRKEVKTFGVAPMSSMFWFGENSRRRFDDFRPEVHDSDGLAIKQGSGESIWRPLSNDTGRLEKNYFAVEKLSGFGLLQRDRRFAAYEDGEAAYDQRPSLWIEPVNDWGPGKVFLMEIPTANELSDNVVAMWEPGQKAQPGQRMEFVYRQHWTTSEDPAKAGGHVVATRTGLHDWQPEQRTIAVEFSGIAPERLKDKDGKDVVPTAVVELVGDGKERAKVQGLAVQSLPGDRWRAGFQIAPLKEGAKLSDVGPLDIRVSLKVGDDFLTETWVNRIIP